MENSNDNLILLCGKSATGKTMSLRQLANPSGVMYLHCEANKKTPFRNKFMDNGEGQNGFTITDPDDIYDAFDYAEECPEVHTIVIDSLTYLLELYHSQNIYRSVNGMQGWEDFQQYFKKLMQHYVANSTKNVIFTAHTDDVLNEYSGEVETIVPVKGSLKKNGIESYFSCVISTKKRRIKDLKGYKSELLNITEEEADLGYKHVFQTRITKDTIGERIRAPFDMYTKEETFTDNNIQLILDRLHEYYQ